MLLTLLLLITEVTIEALEMAKFFKHFGHEVHRIHSGGEKAAKAAEKTIDQKLPDIAEEGEADLKGAAQSTATDLGIDAGTAAALGTAGSVIAENPEILL